MISDIPEVNPIHSVQSVKALCEIITAAEREAAA
jgi:hypothetical protein